MMRLQVRELAGHPLRTAVTVLMLALCTGLAVAVMGLVQSVRSTAERLTEQVAGTADVEVTSAFGGGTVPDELVDDVARVEGVTAAAPIVQSTVAVEGERAALLAGDQRALSFLPDGLAPSLDPSPSDADSAGPSRPEAGASDAGSATSPDTGPATETATVVVSASLADDAGVGPGDRVDVRGPYGVSQVLIGGVLPTDAASGSLLVADLTAGLQIRGGDRGYDRVLLALDTDDATGQERRHDVRRALDGRAVLVDPSQRGRDASEAFEPLVQPLWLLAGLTVTVAGVLVFNVVSVSVAERRRQLAIQCALGGRRRRLWAGLVGEAALLGAVGGTVGAVLGRRVTAALVDQVPPVLANHAFPSRIAVDVPWWLLVAGAAVGLVAAATAAAVASRPVVRLSPLEAMGPRDIVGEPSAAPRPSVVALGLGCMAAGIAAIALGPVAAQTVAALIVLDGVIVLVWALRTPLAQMVALIARRARAAGLLASLAVARSPARNATTLLGALLPVASVVAIGGLQQNAYDTARQGYASLGQPDLYVTAEPFSEVTGEVQLPDELSGELAALDGVESVEPARFGFARIGGGEVFVEGVLPGTAAPGVRLASPAARRALFDTQGLDVIVTRSFANRVGLRPGDDVTLPTPSGSEQARVADVVEVAGWPGGYLALPYDQLATWLGSDAPSLVEVDVDGPQTARAVADVVARHSRQSGLDLEITPGDEAADEALLSVRQSQALFGALQVVLMGAGAFAIVSTLVISTIGRTRELGLLRAVGARRQLVRRAVVVESFVVTLTGAAMGVVVGTLFQLVGVRLATEAVGFPAEFAFALRPSFTALLAGIAIAGVAAVATLRRILRLDILDAVAYE